MHRLSEIVDSRLNPIMVKEVYQAFRSRALFSGALLALTLPLLTYLALLSTAWLDDASGEDRMGRVFFTILLTCIAGVCCVLLPAAAGLQLQNEVRSRTLDLLALTSLSPWQIAFGRFQASLLQTLLLFSYMGPFAVAALAMGGIDVALVLSRLCGTLLLAMAQTALSLFLSSLVIFNTRLRALAWPLLAGGTALLGTAAVALVDRSPKVLEIWWWIAGLLLSSTVLCLRLTADVLTPPALRSYSASKLALLPVLAAIVWPVWSDSFHSRSDKEVLSVLAMIMLHFCSLLWSAAPRSARDGRLLYPLRDGYRPSLAYACLVSGALGLAVSTTGVRLWIVAAFPGYYLLFTSLGVLTHSLLPRRLHSAPRYYAMVLAVLLLNGFASGVVEALAAVTRSSGTRGPLPGWRVFLPLTLDRPDEVAIYLYAAPLLVSIGALAIARYRKASPA